MAAPADLVVDKITRDWCPVLQHGHREPAGWRFACPCCGSGRVLSVQAKGRYPRWNNHCPCDRAEVRARLADLGLVSRRYAPRRPVADRDELAALALADLPPQSLKLALLELSGMTTTEALDKLGIRRSNRARVVSALRNGDKTAGR